MSSSYKRKEPLPIGWKEVIDLPEWGIRNLLAKADTGAKTSAIDVKNLRHLPDGQVSFEVVLDRHDRNRAHKVMAKIVSLANVKSSNGEVQERIKVETLLQIGNHKKRVLFTLVSRHTMICRALLGRDALMDDFLVDASQKYLHGPRRPTSKYRPARRIGKKNKH